MTSNTVTWRRSPWTSRSGTMTLASPTITSVSAPRSRRRPAPVLPGEGSLPQGCPAGNEGLSFLGAATSCKCWVRTLGPHEGPVGESAFRRKGLRSWEGWIATA